MQRLVDEARLPAERWSEGAAISEFILQILDILPVTVSKQLLSFHKPLRLFEYFVFRSDFTVYLSDLRLKRHLVALSLLRQLLSCLALLLQMAILDQSLHHIGLLVVFSELVLRHLG